MARGSTCSNLNYAIIHTEIDRNTSQTTRENEKKNSLGTVKIADTVIMVPMTREQWQLAAFRI